MLELAFELDSRLSSDCKCCLGKSDALTVEFWLRSAPHETGSQCDHDFHDKCFCRIGFWTPRAKCLTAAATFAMHVFLALDGYCVFEKSSCCSFGPPENL